MKIAIITFFILIISSFCHNITEDKEAQAFSDGNQTQGVAYSLGSNGGYMLPKVNSKDYKTPKIVQHLDKNPVYYNQTPINGSIEEIPSTENYYDGEAKLNVFKVTCSFQTNPNDCLHQNGCGWCGQTKQCITGTVLGPTQPCWRNTYLFTTGAPRVENVIHEVNGPTAMTIVNHQ